VNKYESSEKGEMVMTKIFRILALLTAASMLLWVAGCGGDDDDDDDCTDNVAPTVALSPAGGDVFSNSVITATCSKVVETLTVSGGIVATSSDNKVFTFNLPAGAQSITVDCTDACGDSASASGTYTVGAPDNTAPTLVGGDCEPEDGDDGVEPADVESILLVFDENIDSATVTAFEPDANVQATADGTEVLIEFLGQFSLGNEQEVVIEITVSDLAGNESEIEYSFTTMAKE
jgi:Big-like domain-containing protein